MTEVTNQSRILLIEDDKALSKLTIMLLNREHIEVIHAQDGEEALLLLNDQEFNLIITDLNMPQIDGLTLITELREKQSEIPIIVTTGVTNESIHKQLHGLGVVKIYVKPLMSNIYGELIKDIKRYL